MLVHQWCIPPEQVGEGRTKLDDERRTDKEVGNRIVGAGSQASSEQCVKTAKLAKSSKTRNQGLTDLQFLSIHYHMPHNNRIAVCENSLADKGS